MKRKTNINEKRTYHIRRAYFVKNKYSILYCEAYGSYTRIFFRYHNYELASYRLSIIQEELKEYYFVRCHKSYIVNILCIRGIDCHSNKLLLGSGEEIPIARNHKKQILSLLRNLAIIV